MPRRKIADHYAEDGTAELCTGAVLLTMGDSRGALLGQSDGTFVDEGGSTWDYWELPLPLEVLFEPAEGRKVDEVSWGPRIIRTVEELDLLETGTVIIEADGTPLYRGEVFWMLPGSMTLWRSVDLPLPVRIVWTTEDRRDDEH